MIAVEEQETEELRSFRESWKREVREKQRSQQPSQQDAALPTAYHLGEQRAARALEASALAATSVGPEIDMKTVEAFGPGGVTHGVAYTHTKLASSVAHHPDRHVSGVLTRIVADFPEVPSFEPEDEKAPLFLQRLPDELLVHILRYLGTTAIERFACVSRKARVITLDPAIWRLGFLLAFICVGPLCC